ncbi:MAG: M15 family metallopeptidase [Candidatus Woesebacteria bacterium]|jgi:D-alanyl-D-alanine dipeptidase
MKENPKSRTIEPNQLPNINFVEPDSTLLTKLYDELEIIANNLGLQLNLPTLPKKGFLLGPLTSQQEGAVLQLLGHEYASAAVNLQDKLKEIPVRENNERMVSLPKIFEKEDLPLSLSSLPFHEACGEWGGKLRVFWVRERVAERIVKAAKALQAIGVILHLEDAFRPVGVQEGLFYRRIKMILQQHPEWKKDWDKVWIEARSKTAICPWMAGHKSGAAIDITLRYSYGNPLPLGNKYPEGGPKVAVHYPYMTQEQWSTVQLFTMAMEMSGLRIYPYENWHASFGDLSAGIAPFSASQVTNHYTADYGPIKNFDLKTGEIEPYEVEDYFSPFFTKEELLNQLA